MHEISTLRITPEMLVLVAEIDEFKGAWRALGTLAPERLSALRWVATQRAAGAGVAGDRCLRRGTRALRVARGRF